HGPFVPVSERQRGQADLQPPDLVRRVPTLLDRGLRDLRRGIVVDEPDITDRKYSFLADHAQVGLGQNSPASAGWQAELADPFRCGDPGRPDREIARQRGIGAASAAARTYPLRGDQHPVRGYLLDLGAQRDLDAPVLKLLVRVIA